jgi:hypothetical protein
MSISENKRARHRADRPYGDDNDLVYTIGPGMINNTLGRHQPDTSGGATASQCYRYDHRGNIAGR